VSHNVSWVKEPESYVGVVPVYHMAITHLSWMLS